jgi:hypothetical protein
MHRDSRLLRETSALVFSLSSHGLLAPALACGILRERTRDAFDKIM